MLDRMPEWALGKKLGKLHIMDLLSALRGGIKKNKLVFVLRKTPKGGRGGLTQSKISLSEKTKTFLDFFSSKGGWSHHGDFWIFSPKG